MSKSSMHSQCANKNSSAHMMRESKVTYLVEPNCKKNLFKKYGDVEKFKTNALDIYKNKVGQNMQKKGYDNLIKEAVLNCEADTNIEDIENTFKALNEKFGGHKILEVAIHKDEGYFFHVEDDLEYRPGKDIHYNEADKKFYLNKSFTTPANMKDFNIVYNYHAHVLYSNFEVEQGKNIRMNKKDMRDLQTVVADSMGMARGKVNSNAVRQTHYQLKAGHDKARDIKVKALAKIKSIEKVKKELQLKIKESSWDIHHKKKEYALLKEEVEKWKELARNKELTEEQLQEYKEQLEMSNDYNELLKDELSDEKKYLENSLDSNMQLENKLEEVEETNYDEIIALKREISSLTSENSYLRDNVLTTVEKDEIELLQTTFKSDDIEIESKSRFVDWVKAKFDSFVSKIRDLKLEVFNLKEENKSLKIDNEILIAQLPKTQNRNNEMTR